LFCSTEKSVVPSAAATTSPLDNRRVRINQECGIGNPLEAFGPIVAAAGENVHTFVGDMELYAVAIKFYLGSIANRSAFSRSWRQARVQ
jgi:hypothetical protein